MNLLEEVISSSEDVDVKTLTHSAPNILQKIEETKHDLYEFINKIYKAHIESPHRNATLAKNLDEINKECTGMHANLQELKKNDVKDCAKSTERYADQLRNFSLSVDVISQVMSVHEALAKVKLLKEQKLYVQVYDTFNEISRQVEGIPEAERVKALDELLRTSNELLEDFIFKLENVGHDNFICSKSTVGNQNLHCLKVKGCNEDMRQAFKVLGIHKLHSEPIVNITKYLWGSIFLPLVLSDTEIDIKEVEGMHVLEMQVRDPRKNSYIEVFEKMSQVLNFLRTHFEYELTEGFFVMNCIGEDIRDNLSELLIKNCLHDTIPSTAEGLQRYKEVIERVEDFQRELIASRLFTEADTSLLDYANNVDILFINKKCQEYLSSALTFMKKDLHDYVDVGTPYDTSKPMNSQCLGFLECAISKSCVELLKLAEKMLEKARASSEVCAGRLYCTVENIFHQYTSAVARHHEKLLHTIPQQVALFHNNCLYLQHELLRWNDVYKSKLPVEVDFSKVARLLESSGIERFDAYLQQQLKQIVEIMSECGLQNVQTLESLEPRTEKSVRQCLRQQELLKTVWQKVLPYTTYNQSLGMLLNALCDSLINAVVDKEDISSEAAEQLIDVLKVVLTRGPKLFTEPKEINLYVEKWHKTNELVFILSSRLLDINDRWADGKGPLALHFKPQEVKRLIRALFQNTDTRASVLAKIRDM